MSRFEAVISDFGGVLTSPLFRSFAAFQEEHGIPPEALGTAMAALTADGGNPLFELEKGRITEADFLARVGGALEREVGRPVDMSGFPQRFFDQLEANEPFAAYLRRVRDERGLRLALLTNNVREWEARWRSLLPIDDLFELVVDSAFVGLRKPDRAIYELTLERLGLPAQACVFVDDLEVNCEAARVVGMTPVHFRDTEQAIAELEALLG